MKKRFLLLVTTFMLIAGTISAAVTVRYYNKDSKTYKFKVKMSGSTKTVEFGSSRTSSVTIQGNAEECVVYTDCGEVTLRAGDKITIKDGCITVD
ncbi:MAG: hypothetical protein AAF570_25095 [Bacteroidota bacterium]